MIVYTDEFRRVGPDGREYFFPEDGDYGVREDIGTNTCYITDGSTVWRADRIMYMDGPDNQHSVIEMLGLWLEFDEPAVVVWENGGKVSD
jgi:hypothetical protein